MSSLARRKALSPAKGSEKRQRTVEEEGAIQDVQTASASLLQTALQFRTGACRLVPAARISPVVQWSHYERRLQTELRLCLAAAGVSPTTEQGTDEDLERAVVVLQNLLTEMATQVNRDEAVVCRIHSSQLLLKQLFSDDQKLSTEELKRLVLHRDSKTSQLLATHAHQTELTQELDQMQVRIVELRRENRELYAQLKGVTAPQDASSADVNQEMTSNLEAQKARNVILRNVVQLLVLESGINWAQEPTLRAVFLG